ncbi:hypothetical protein BJ170DRAFT_600104 [Xylariales sp. AK1849]|nr:hypothetical protein BJ170DRAFT_600104 [Xylariales sp. AK1849]
MAPVLYSKLQLYDNAAKLAAAFNRSTNFTAAVANSSYTTAHSTANITRNTTQADPSKGTFRDAGTPDWYIGVVILGIVLLAMVGLLAVDIRRKQKSSEFQKGMKDAGKGIVRMGKAAGHSLINLPGAMITAPKNTYSYVRFRLAERRARDANKEASAQNGAGKGKEVTQTNGDEEV